MARMSTVDAPVVPPDDVSFLKQLCRYFGIKGVRICEATGKRHDISILPDTDVPTIYVGPVWHRRRKRSLHDGRLALTHELLHTQGLEHDEYGRSVGYYSKDRERDVLPRVVYRDLVAGTRTFSPDRFGLDPQLGHR